jgi:acyl-coenzyme A synthetase/AMP-(fatty) acid ligase
MRNFDANAALETIRRRSITHWSSLPETFAELQKAGAERVRATDTSSLRELIVGGAAAPWTLKVWLADTFGPIVSEAYGSTAAGVIATMSVDLRSERIDSCGRPIRGVTVEIRDTAGRRLPPGSVGEIWARTRRSLECDLPLSASYARRDEEGFVATGDAGKMDAEGFIYIVGKSYELHEANVLQAG